MEENTRYVPSVCLSVCVLYGGFQGDEEVTRVYVEQSSLAGLRELLVGSGLECRSTQLVYVPKVLVDCSDEDFENNLLAIESLEALDDVDACQHNSE